MIAETNQGYDNSEIPVRLVLHCILESEVADGLDASSTLRQFSSSSSTSTEIRKGADAAILLVNSYSRQIIIIIIIILMTMSAVMESVV